MKLEEEGLLLAESLRNAHCSTVVFSKVLAARKKYLIIARAREKKKQRWHARKCWQNELLKHRHKDKAKADKSPH